MNSRLIKFDSFERIGINPKIGDQIRTLCPKVRHELYVIAENLPLCVALGVATEVGQVRAHAKVSSNTRYQYETKKFDITFELCGRARFPIFVKLIYKEE